MQSKIEESVESVGRYSGGQIRIGRLSAMGSPRGGDHTLVRGQRYAATPGANPNIIGMGTRGHRNVAPPLVFNSPPVSQGYVSGSSVTRPTIRK